MTQKFTPSNKKPDNFTSEPGRQNRHFAKDHDCERFLVIVNIGFEREYQKEFTVIRYFYGKVFMTPNIANLVEEGT